MIRETTHELEVSRYKMQDTRNESYIDADRLAEEFLIVNCIWDPVGKLCQDGDTVHPALERYLATAFVCAF